MKVLLSMITARYAYNVYLFLLELLNAVAHENDTAPRKPAA